MKFTLKTAIIGIAVVILIVIYSGLYTLKRACRGLSCSLADRLGNR